MRSRILGEQERPVIGQVILVELTLMQSDIDISSTAATPLLYLAIITLIRP